MAIIKLTSRYIANAKDLIILDNATPKQTLELVKKEALSVLSAKISDSIKSIVENNIKIDPRNTDPEEDVYFFEATLHFINEEDMKELIAIAKQLSQESECQSCKNKAVQIINILSK